MIKRKQLYIPIIVILVIVAFKLQAFISPSEITTDRIEPEIENSEPSHLNEIESIITEYDSILTSEVKKSGIVGTAIVITYKNEIALLRCFGVQKKGEKNAINKHTIFRLASVSKTVTGVLAGILDDENLVDLDEKVVNYLPDFKLKNSESTKSISVRHLLSHTSGLIPHAYDLMVEDHVPLEKIMSRLSEVDIAAPPGKLYGYQNVVYSIYDPIASKQTNKSFDSLLNEKIFIPFGMSDASTGYGAFKNNDNKAYPHYNQGGNKYGVMRLNDRYYNTIPAAGINASISDLGQFLITLTNENSKNFSNNARETIFTPQVNSLLKRTYFRSWDKVQSKQYSIGWRIVGYKGRKIAYHGGYVSGYKAEIALCNEEDIGIAILTNSPNNSSAKTIPTFLNMLFKYKDALTMEKNSEVNEQDKS
ncbi:MAG: serine hydrolase [Draconibacterium sp.]|nr:serine hydrolase [Draconibacterium sp.]